MKNKLVFASGLAVGYVLGTRAGRANYEKLKVKARELWRNPKVQETVSEAAGAVKSKAPEVQEQAVQAVKKASETIGSALHRESKHNEAGGEPAGQPVSTGTTSASTGPGNPPETTAVGPDQVSPEPSADTFASTVVTGSDDAGRPRAASISDESPFAESGRRARDKDVEQTEESGS